MSWTANLDSITKNQGNALVVVRYSNGVDPDVTETLSVASPTQLKQTVINRIAQLHAVDTYVASTTLGPIDTTVSAPVPPPDLTPAQIAQQTFLADISTYKQYKLAIGYGLMTNTDPAFTALVAKIKAEFLPAYAPLLT